jgi:hypothetical protein
MRLAILLLATMDVRDGKLSENSSLTHAQYRDFVKSTYLRNVRMFSGDDLPFTLEAFSDEFFAAWRASQEVVDVFGRLIRLGGPISFCFVDGSHSYDTSEEISRTVTNS